MLEEMRRNVRDASLIVKNLFSQFDLHARGCVSGEQFLRVISCHGLLSADKVRKTRGPYWLVCQQRHAPQFVEKLRGMDFQFSLQIRELLWWDLKNVDKLRFHVLRHAWCRMDQVLDMERYGHVLVKAFTERVDGPGLEAAVVNYKKLHDQVTAVDWLKDYPARTELLQYAVSDVSFHTLANVWSLVTIQGSEGLTPYQAG